MEKSILNDTLNSFGIPPEAIPKSEKYQVAKLLYEKAFTAHQDEEEELDEIIDTEIEEEKYLQSKSNEN